MPNNESLFAISFDRLMSGEGPLSVMGLSGNALLRIEVNSTPNGKSFCIFMPPAKSPLLAVVCQSPSSHGSPVAIFKEGNVKFGEVVAQGNQYRLIVGSALAIWMAFDRGTGTLNLHDGSSNVTIAAASRTEPTDYSNEKHLEVCVNPGVDGVLVLCCVLAVFFPWTE